MASSSLPYLNRKMTTRTVVVCLKENLTSDAAGARKLNISLRDQKLKSGSRTSTPMPEI